MEISVIIPCYNAYHLMWKCLDALEKQMYKDFEVIVVDDCSTDNSFEQLLQYKKISELKMEVCQTPKNVGPGEARNYAIKKANGKYLAFCDSDDWYEHDYLEKMHDELKKSNADIVMCNYQKVFDNNSIKQVNYTAVFSNAPLQKEYVAFSKASFCLLILNAKLFDNLEIPKVYNGEDMAVIPVLLGKATRVTHVSDVLYNYYIRNNSLSNRPKPNVYQNLLLAFQYIEEHINKENYREELEFIGIRTVLYGVALNALKAKVSVEEIKSIVLNFEQRYSDWKNNRYLNKLGHFQKIFVDCVRLKMWIVLRLLAKIHYYYTRK